MEKENIKKEILMELIVDKIYECLGVTSEGTIYFDKYDIDVKDVQHLLKKLDEERYNAYCEMLLNNKEN